MTAEDWPAVARIYAAGIAEGSATFESEVPTRERWSAARGELPCLVAKDGGVSDGVAGNGGVSDGEARDGGSKIVGWAALTPFSPRFVYRGVAAISIYVDPEHRREGVARTLLGALIEASEQAGLWTLEAGIFPENIASIALHESCGFRLVGVRHRVGQMPDGSWRDVLLYERRSETVGAE